MHDPEDYPLSILPGISEVFDERLSKEVPMDLVTLVSMTSQNGVKTIDRMLHHFEIMGSDSAPFRKALKTLPDITLEANSLQPGTLNVTLSRKNNLQDRDGRIFAPRFPKPQTEGYFVLISPAAGGADEILALKRANWPAPTQGSGGRGRLSNSVKIKLEAAYVERKVNVVVMSDAYPGMEWRVDNVTVAKREIQTVEVMVDEDLKKGKQAGSDATQSGGVASMSAVK